MKNIVLIAPPGAGKGTQAKMLCEKYKIPHISVGDLLRREIENNGLYKEILQEKMSSGLLVDDEIIFNLMNQRLNKDDCNNGFILDGFPRNVNQAIELDKMSKKIDIIIYLNTPKNILEKRVLGRMVCSNCGYSFNLLFDESKPKEINKCDNCKSTLEKRKDDNLETFENRYNTYIKETQPVLDYYKEKNILYNITTTDKYETFNMIVNILGE